jgi:hypothetical protein
MTCNCSLSRTILILTAALCITHHNASAEPLKKSTGTTIVAPLLADPLEPKIAVMPSLSERTLQLDIGSSTDLYQSDSKEFAVGVDFGTYSRLKRTHEFKFPVDAIDYLFGVNASWKKPFNSDMLPFDIFSAKVKLSHISAHFEDGHYSAGQWITQSEWTRAIPFTYSREFVNVVLALSSPKHRVYAGYQYLYHTLPAGINPHAFQAGIELSTPGNTYIATDLKLLPVWQPSLEATRGHRGTWNLQAGVHLDGIGLEKVRVACTYYSGISRQGMYFYHPESFTTAGIIIDF